MQWWKLPVFFVLLCLLPGGCRPAAAPDTAGKPLVFVSILPQAAFVEKIAGDLVDVRVMVGPGQSPATYEPSPQQMAQLSRARLYFRIGVPFENVWIERLAEINPQMKIIDTREGIELRTMAAHTHHEEGHEEEGKHHDHDEEAAGGILDPHIWLDPNLVKTQAETIGAALAAEFPGEKAQFESNLEEFIAELSELDGYIRQKLAGLERRTFLVFHPSWGYFADAYGLEQVTIESEGKEPGGQALAQIIEHAREEQVGTVFVQKQFSARTAQTIAKAIGARVVELDPLARDYAANLRRVADVLAQEIGQ